MEVPQQGPAWGGEQRTHESLWQETAPAASAPQAPRPWCIQRAVTASRTFVTLYYGVVIPGGRAVYIVLHSGT